MKNPFKNSANRHPLLRFLTNRYFLVFAFFVVWMIFLDNYSLLDHRILDKEINELEDNKEYYKDEIKLDEEKIKLLKNPDQIEKYAREKYYMKRDSEDIYIIEFEDDLPEEEVVKNKSL